ncbi:MAG: DUF3846 domain-containing protein [Microbacterium sp.]
MTTLRTATGLAIAPDGTTREFDFTPGDALAVFQQHVGGFIEPVDLSDQITLYADEEGLLKYRGPAFLNRAAINLIIRSYGESTPIMGPVIAVGGLNRDGDNIGLTREQITYLTRTVAEATGQVR